MPITRKKLHRQPPAVYARLPSRKLLCTTSFSYQQIQSLEALSSDPPIIPSSATPASPLISRPDLLHRSTPPILNRGSVLLLALVDSQFSNGVSLRSGRGFCYPPFNRASPQDSPWESSDLSDYYRVCLRDGSCWQVPPNCPLILNPKRVIQTLGYAPTILHFPTGRPVPSYKSYGQDRLTTSAASNKSRKRHTPYQIPNQAIAASRNLRSSSKQCPHQITHRSPSMHDYGNLSAVSDPQEPLHTTNSHANTHPTLGETVLASGQDRAVHLNFKDVIIKSPQPIQPRSFADTYKPPSQHKLATIQLSPLHSHVEPAVRRWRGNCHAKYKDELAAQAAFDYALQHNFVCSASILPDVRTTKPSTSYHIPRSAEEAENSLTAFVGKKCHLWLEAALNVTGVAAGVQEKFDSFEAAQAWWNKLVADNSVEAVQDFISAT
ncbi:hypothetical protein DL96DRAFT_1562776 [Flagelloscypha sp. PMI_526]|nr:hypothetical protein DL96DRAFT_1562776 [Flagelloscypha sp. PMI_526]